MIVFLNVYLKQIYILNEKLDRFLPNVSGYKWLCLIIVEKMTSFKMAGGEPEISRHLQC